MTYLVRFAPEAELDLLQLYDFILERDGGEDHFADKAFEAIKHGVTHLSLAPFNCRKAYPGKDPYLRELVIPFGASGYVALFEIEPHEVVTVIAVRHQREDDFF
jgi:plasmid stabilization system protein ParE